MMMKLFAYSFGLLVVLPITLVLLFTPGDIDAWGWCGFLWISFVPFLIPLLEYLRGAREPAPKDHSAHD
jgi:hypothetical protein